MYKSNFAEYLALEKHYSPLTVKAYAADIDAFDAYVKSEGIGAGDIHELGYEAARSWLVYMVEKGISTRSINRKMSSLKAYYRFLLKTKTIHFSPLAKHRSLKTSKRVQLPFSEPEVYSVLESGNTFFKENFEGLRDRLIVELLYATGIRRSELRNLKLSNIDSSVGQIKVLGKRSKERVVPLTKNALSSINAYLPEREKLPCIVDQEILLLSSRGKMVSESLIYRLVRLVFGKVSSKHKTSPHILRHTFATHILNRGADMNSVKELLGHSSLASTQVYTGNSISTLKEIYKKAHPRGYKT